MQDSKTIHWDDHDRLEVLTFELGEECLAIEAAMVREIADLLPETAVPGAPPLVASIANFRGKIIPVADLRLAFAMERGQTTVDSRIVVIETMIGDEPVQLGIRTDKVHEVTALNRDDSETPPAVGLRWPRHHVRSLVRAGGRAILIPDLDAIFGAAPSHGSSGNNAGPRA